MSVVDAWNCDDIEWDVRNEEQASEIQQLGSNCQRKASHTHVMGPQPRPSDRRGL